MPSNDIYTPETILPTRLYIKQHSITGLKYFGKTIQDPYTYLGSGTRWLNHIKKHGREFVETLWVSEPYTNATLIQEDALKLSQENNIVESSEWANLELETGLNRGYNYCQPTKEFIDQRSIMIQTALLKKYGVKSIFSILNKDPIFIEKRQIKMLEKYGVKSIFSHLNKDPEFQAKRKESFTRIGHQQGEKHSQFGTMWITDGTISTKIKKEDIIPDGWRKGRICKKKINSHPLLANGAL